MDSIAGRLAAVRARIAQACRASGRDPGEVRLLPVSKTRPARELREALAAGESRFGENQAQEAAGKAAELADVPGLTWAMIGHLQTNKAKLVARFAAEFQALDSLRLAAELDRRLQAEGRAMDVLIQVNSSGEESKFGLPPADVVGFAAALRPFDSLHVMGLMTLALPSPQEDAVSACFDVMRVAQRHLWDTVGLPGSYDELSMGMSGDFELAIAHGSTCVRIGTAIFGQRG